MKKPAGQPPKKSPKKSAAAAKAAPAKPPAAKPAKASKAAKPAKAATPAKATKPPKPAASNAPRDADDDFLAALVAKASAEAASQTAGPADDKVGLDKVMASLTQIFGGRDFLSDAELDAFLDSKMESGEIPPSLALDPLDEAQSLIYEAWNSEGPEKIDLARRALDLSEECADAYIILAQEDAKTQEASLALYRKAVDAGKRALPAGVFEKSQGRFWEIMETRPYMRARLGLAECLWDLAKKEEALGHLRELMRLNPADDQGVRYILLQCLLESGADDELGALLAKYGKDAAPEIRYTNALWLFRRHGPGKIADAALAEALRASAHVPAYLLKRKSLPKRTPASSEAGSASEAEAYASGAHDAWHKTLGAQDWLAAHSPD